MSKLQLFIGIIMCAGAVLAQDNRIKNGDFTDSTGVHWTLESNGAQAQGAVLMGKYIVSIEGGVSSEFTPRLVQRGISLAAGEGYVLSFKVSASDTGKIRVLVAGDNTMVFSDSSEGLITVETTVATCSVPFFVDQSTGNAQVMFNCGLSPNINRISIDSVTLVRSTVPMIRMVQPGSGVRWISGSERQITWLNSGALDNVMISFSPDKGNTWQLITPVASNQESFWWHIPAEVSGKECMIIVSDTAETIADTSGLFTIVAAGTVDAREMIRNGSFLDTTDWRFSATDPAQATGGLVNDEFVMNVDSLGGEAWQVKLEQSSFTLENGSMYRFSFDAYASHEREIFANVGADNGNPAWSVYGGDTIPVRITKEKTRYYQTIIMKYPTSGNIRIEFNCGNDTGKVCIDNVSLIKHESANVFIINPSLGTILKTGAKYNIEWHAREVSTLNLEYSADSGATWATIFKGIDNLGVVSWTVPEVSSERCFIRISNAVNDSVLGQSSQFVINAFGTMVRTGELIVNGSFSNNLQGWNTSFNNAQGQALTTDQLFRINITEPGDEYATIVLSQNGIPVLKDKEYSVSFAAFANGTRSMCVRVVLENDSSTIMNDTISLPSVGTKMEFTFTAQKDAMVRIEFLMGGSRAAIFLDDVSFYTGGVAVKPAAGVRMNAPSAPRFSVRTMGASVLFQHCTEGAAVTVYSLQGKVLRRLTAGTSPLYWDRLNAHGGRVASGTYLAVQTAPKVHECCRFLIK